MKRTFIGWRSLQFWRGRREWSGVVAGPDRAKVAAELLRFVYREDLPALMTVLPAGEQPECSPRDVVQVLYERQRFRRFGDPIERGIRPFALTR
jgi:hypothetical protein